MHLSCRTQGPWGARAEMHVKGTGVPSKATCWALRLPGATEMSQAWDGVERCRFEWSLPRLARGLERTQGRPHGAVVRRIGENSLGMFSIREDRAQLWLAGEGS